MRYSALIVFVALLFSGIRSKAQYDRFEFSRLDISNGLSNNQVTCIFKDKTGFMWFGTSQGLNKYDGSKFEILKHSETDSTSLNDDFIASIAAGPDNKMWVETRNGFNIYDPVKDCFGHDIAGYLKSINIPDANITTVKSDKKGNFWFIHAVYGIYKYNPVSKTTFHIAHIPGDSTSIYSNNITDVAFDNNNNPCLIFRNGIIDRLDSQNKVVYRWGVINKNNTLIDLPFKLFIDDDNGFWAFVPTYSSAVFYFDPVKNIYRHFDKGTGPASLSNDIVYNIIQDAKNQVWIATDHGGINVVNKTNFTVKLVLNREDDNKSLGQNSTICMYKDNTGIIWIGTYKRGISYYNESIIKFPLYTHHFSDPHSLPFNDINKFIEDKSGNLWLGTNGGGLIYFDRKENTFKTYLHDPQNANSLCNNIIVTMCMDHNQKLWIGTYFGGLDCFDGHTFTHYRHTNADPGSISDDRVYAIYEDDAYKLWVGTLAGGLNVLDPATKKFTHFKAGEPNSIHSNYISAIVKDRNKNMWILTSYGVDVLPYGKHKFTHYIHINNNSNSLVNNNTNNILQDSRGLIWISTREGLSIFDPVTQKFKNFKKSDGLPDNTVIDLEEDNAHNIWASTQNGLSNIVVSGPLNKVSLRFINYNEIDGLQGREFTENASCKTRECELIFGGGSGFNLFDPLKIHINNTALNLVFTDFDVFNQLIKAGEKVNGHVILPQSVQTVRSIILKHDENRIAIEFACLNYFNDKIRMQYKMDGFDNDWITTDNSSQKATYTNLDAGDYTFRVRTLNNRFSNNEISLIIHVLPPFWMTSEAYLLYFMLAAGSLYLIRMRGIKKLKLQFALEKEREEARRLHELDLMKIKFFTNISHEFRTPLSLIMAPIDKVIKQTSAPGIKQQLEFANRNARRLLNMVNQLLDFRKMESQELKLNLEEGELILFIKDVAYSFNDIAEKKNISYTFDTGINELYCSFDHDKIERILFNILSNAFKFTPSGGHVSVVLDITMPVKAFTSNLQIRIIDTGIGISKEKIGRIFDPFFQDDIPTSMVNQGSGIGLSITKEFVKLHNGTISVESVIGEGSSFTVSIPVKVIAAGNSIPASNDHAHLQSDTQPASGYANTTAKKATVLVVEDDADFRFYITDNLKGSFTVVEASDGKEGWQKALASHPNIVVSDISMPEMDGIELCKKIKKDSRTTHIPVILLTALTGEEQQLKGLETGASDYVTKPFNFDILRSKIKNILAQQENMRKTYQKQVEVKPADVEVESPDEAFLQKALRLIEENIGNPNFSVEELSSEMFVSRYTLYKKILALTGKTPNEFIRYMRLKRAAQLLENGYLTISQVGYKVGFKNQKYFVKAFKSEFNVSPSAYIEGKMVSEK